MPDCIVLAAGASSRMGECKPLLAWGGSTMAGAVIAAARSAGCRIILVTGCRGDRVRERLRADLSSQPDGMGLAGPDPVGPQLAGSEPGIEFVHNPDWEEGMTGSIQSALPFVKTDSFFIIHADMPLVESRVYRLLADDEGRRRAEEAGIALFAAWKGRAGHPVLLPSSRIPAMLDLGPGARMRDFVEAGAHALVETDCEGVILDIDKPEEYAAALRHPAAPAPHTADCFH